jgi:hypothetical protein
MAYWHDFDRIEVNYVLDIKAYDVSNADALVEQTNKIKEHSSTHAHQLSHVNIYIVLL